MTRFRKLWEYLRSSFWFVPSLIVVASIAFALMVIDLDSAGSDRWLAKWPRLFAADAQGARGMMSTIAGSMMSVVGVTFSMILVVLALASSQYTSRILRNFMRNRPTQVVLGVFAGIFTYCLIVLRTIRDGEPVFIPTLAVFFGFVLALGGVGTLMFFIHHIAASIQASSIVASASEETIAAVDRLFPESSGDGPGVEEDEATYRPPPGWNWHTVSARQSGYIQSVDHAALLQLATEKKTVVWIEHVVGDFIVEDTTLASLSLGDPPDKETIAAVQAAVDINRHRTVEQDAAFGIRQIVDVALKALSRGINDSTTAVMCVDHLTAILARIATRRMPPSLFLDGGEVRVVSKGPSFESLLDESFDQIRGSAKGDLAIMTRMLGALQTVAGRTAAPDRRRALRGQVGLIAELAERSLESTHDRARIDVRLARVREVLEAGPAAVRPGMRR